MSTYGKAFDNWAAEYARLENDHDRMHPDRSACGGVGACPMMREAVDIEHRLIGLLDEWRVQRVHVHCGAATPCSAHGDPECILRPCKHPEKEGDAS